MAMLRSAIRLTFRQSAPRSRFVGNGCRRNPASSITSKRNYYNGSEYDNDFRKEDFDFTGWTSMDFLFNGVGCATGLVFYHKIMTSRYNRPHRENISTFERGCHEKAEKKELFEVSMSN